MDIHSKNGEAWGTVYVLLFKIDGIDSVRTFTTLDKATKFASTMDGYKTLFSETLDREEVIK